RSGLLLLLPRALLLLAGAHAHQSESRHVRVVQSLLCGRGRPLRAPPLGRHPDRPPLLLMIEPFETRPHDVLVLGAGGAGLRAAIAAKEAGADVGLVCKSLLGKAHTVMAEGGIASSLANVDPQDGWQVHFADTMRGGKNLNNWHMVELFAKEAP